MVQCQAGCRVARTRGRRSGRIRIIFVARMKFWTCRICIVLFLWSVGTYLLYSRTPNTENGIDYCNDAQDRLDRYSYRHYIAVLKNIHIRGEEEWKKQMGKGWYQGGYKESRGEYTCIFDRRPKMLGLVIPFNIRLFFLRCQGHIQHASQSTCPPHSLVPNIDLLVLHTFPQLFLTPVSCFPPLILFFSHLSFSFLFFSFFFIALPSRPHTLRLLIQDHGVSSSTSRSHLLK